MIQTIKNKSLLVGVVISALILITPAAAFSHITVKPTTAKPSAYQTFTTNVPNEKEIPVTEVRLIIPSGINSVTPTVKQGWKITTKKTGDKITEITWSGGTIEVGLRDEFTFSAQAPAKEGELIWKAYQTYQDGSVVSWDQKPTTDHGHASGDESKGPYSTTTIKEEKDNTRPSAEQSKDTLPYIISAVAVLLSAFALVRASKKE